MAREKPGGGTYFVDPNQSGQADDLHVVSTSWGRLVDVHDVDALGEPNPEPIFRDFVIGPNVMSDGQDYLLEKNPATKRTRLVVLRQMGAQAPGQSFLDLAKKAGASRTTVVPKNDDGTSPGPFPMVARNSAIVIQFDDLLDDDAEAMANLDEAVQVLTGYPPDTPYTARILFDPNHGGVFGDSFHSTRVIVDLTISQRESQELATLPPPNMLGLPRSLEGVSDPNVALRLPTEIDFGAGQFAVLTNLAGATLDTSGNGPVDVDAPTLDLVRAMRSGRLSDPENGFLPDREPPQLLGGFGVTVDSAQADPGGRSGFDFLVDLSFTTPCQADLREGDLLEAGPSVLRVTAPAALSGATASDVEAEVLTGVALPDASALVGAGTLLTPFDPAAALPLGCWISFTPVPDQPPAGGVSTNAVVIARFSEPMDPAGMSPLDIFRIVRGESSMTSPVFDNLVVGTVQPGPELDVMTFAPLLPFAHTEGVADPYHVRFGRSRDLAGNIIEDVLPPVDFTIDPFDPTEENGGIVMRFADSDEVGAEGEATDGLPDLRGQVTYDLAAGTIQPRPVQFDSYPIDRMNTIPSLMTPLPAGVSDPLVALGSKVQTVWRYADLGWEVLDETKHNLDVVGLNWSPIGGQVTADFFEDFEIRLSHSEQLPDEGFFTTTLVPKYPQSGLLGAPSFFADNVLDDPRSPQKVVHPRPLGYRIQPNDQFLSATNTPLMPFPMNRGEGPLTSYTWRDTAVLAEGGDNGTGLPMDIEVFAQVAPGPPGSIEPASQVPSYGLPLLMEFRSYPTSAAIGLNSFDASLASVAVPPFVVPHFRTYSSGGTNTAGDAVEKNPDLELVPSGGFNPTSSPPGQKTRFNADSVFYLGQLDTVVKVSRAHTVWLDTQRAQPSFRAPVIEPPATLLPGDTDVVIEYRGAIGFGGMFGEAPFDATQMDPYGDITSGTVMFLNGRSDWTREISELDGARYLQARFTFVNDIVNRLSPELSGFAVAYED